MQDKQRRSFSSPAVCLASLIRGRLLTSESRTWRSRSLNQLYTSNRLKWP